MKTQNHIIKSLFTGLFLIFTVTLFATIEITETIHASVGVCDGQINTYTNGTAGPFMVTLYQVDANDNLSLIDTKGPTQGNLTFTDLCTGDYRISVSGEISSCEIIRNTTIEECTEITITDSPIITPPQDCNSADGGFRFLSTDLPQGGTPPYTYLWSNGHTELTIDGLSAGTYGLTITDALGCTGTASYTLEGETAPSVTLTIQEPSCENQSNGTLAISTFANGDYTLYDFSWSNGHTTSSDIVSKITDLPSGTYSVTISIPGGACSFVYQFDVLEVSADTPLEVLGDIVNACHGFENSGGIDLTVNGGVAPYSVQWDHSTSGSFHLKGLSNGQQYCATVTDYCGATASACYDIESSLNLISIDGTTTMACPPYESSTYTPQPGGVQISVSGGHPPYRYFWSNGTYDKDLTNVEARLYCVTVSDQYNCKQVECFEVEAYELDINLVDFQNCVNGACSQAFIDVDLVGTAASPYAVQWWPSASTNEDLTYIPSPGIYKINVRDANYCRYTEEFEITDCADAEDFEIAYSVVVPASPINDELGIIQLGLSPESNNYSYTWTGPNGFTASQRDIVGNGPGSYIVTIANGCGTTISETFEITACSLDIEVLNVNSACSSEGYAKVDIRINNVSVNDEFFLYAGEPGFLPLSVKYDTSYGFATASIKTYPGEGCFVILNQDLCGGLACTTIESSTIETVRLPGVKYAYNPMIDRHVPYFCVTRIFCQGEERDTKINGLASVLATATPEGGCSLAVICGESILATYSGQTVTNQTYISGSSCRRGNFCVADVDVGLSSLARFSAPLGTEYLGEVDENEIERDGLCITQRSCNGQILEEINNGTPSVSIECGREHGYGYTCVQVSGCEGYVPTITEYPFQEAHLCCGKDLVFSWLRDPNNTSELRSLNQQKILPGLVAAPQEGNQFSTIDGTLVHLDNVAFSPNNESMINIFPNPFEDQVMVEVLDESLYDTSITLRVLNNLGQTIENITFKSSDDNYILDLTGFSSGIYYIHFQIHTGYTWVEKIIKSDKP